MPEEQKKHPLDEYSENEQVAYLSILSAVCYVDKEFGDKEKRQLDVLLAQLKISDVGKAKIYSSVFNLQHENKLANLEAILILGNTELKYTLISDLCLFSLVDSKFTDEEYQYILGIGEILGITQEQVDAIKSIQENLDKIKDIPSNSKRFRQVIKDNASKLAGVGVPTNIPPPTNAPSAAKPEVIPAALSPKTEPLAAIAPIGTPTPARVAALSFMTRLNLSEFEGISLILSRSSWIDLMASTCSWVIPKTSPIPSMY